MSSNIARESEIVIGNENSVKEILENENSQVNLSIKDDSGDEYDGLANLLYDENDFFKDLDPNSIFTTKHAVSSIVEYDSTVHFVGLIKDIEAPVYKGSDDDTLLFKFIVESDDNQRVQCYAWQEDAARVIPLVKLNHVIHIDGGFSTRRNTTFSRGNTEMDLTIRSNTLINTVAGSSECVPSQEVELVPFESICSAVGIVMVQAYMKAPFRQYVGPDSSLTYETGCISSGKYKLEVRLQSSENPKIFARGDHVLITGRVQFHGNLPHLVVENYSKIHKSSEPSLADGELLKATVIPKRSPMMNSEVLSKKSKAD